MCTLLCLFVCSYMCTLKKQRTYPQYARIYSTYSASNSAITFLSGSNSLNASIWVFCGPWRRTDSWDLDALPTTNERWNEMKQSEKRKDRQTSTLSSSSIHPNNGNIPGSKQLILPALHAGSTLSRTLFKKLLKNRSHHNHTARWHIKRTQSAGCY